MSKSQHSNSTPKRDSMKPMTTGLLLVAGSAALIGFAGAARGQQVFFNGASVHVEPGAQIYVQGGLTNQGSGQITSNGTITLTGDWENNASNNVFTPGDTGVVVLDGAAQTVQGTSPTHFARLVLNNNAVKTLNLNAVVTDHLDIDSCELALGNDTLHLTNPAANALSVSPVGFVSNSLNGALVRSTNSTGTYLYPMGSTVGTPRYRPVNIAPANANANDFSVGFVNSDPNNDGFLTSNAQAPACWVNDQWYHHIGQLTGSSNADVTIAFDDQLDTVFTGIANYTSNNWTDQGNANLVSNVSPQLSTLTANVTAFTDLPFGLTINTIPSNITPMSSTTICQGDSVQLDADFDHTIYTWLRNGTPIPGVGSSDTAIYANQAGTYQLVGSNGICADTSQGVVVTVNPLPNPAISNPGTLCAGGNATNLSAATPGGTWSGTGITNPTAGTFDPNVSGTGSIQVIYNVTVNGCSDADTTNITVNTLPDASFTSPAAVCDNGSPVALTPTNSGGTFQGSGVTGSTFDPTAAGTGAISVSYILSANGCTDTATNTITVNQSPNIAFSAQPLFCQNGQSANLSATPTGGTWSGTGITSANNGTFDPSVSGVGNFNAIYTVTDNNNCTSIDTQSVAVNALPDPSFTAPATVCDNAGTIQFTATTSGGTWSGNGVVNASQGTFDPATAGTGVSQILYTVDNNGCQDTSSEFVDVLPAPNAQIASQTALCDNDGPLNLSATPAGGSWSGTGITDASLGTFDPSIAGSGTAQVAYTATAGQCSDTDTLDITINPAPDAVFSVTSPLCVTDNPVVLNPNTAGGSFSGNGVSGTSFDPAQAGAGIIDVVHTVSANGCTAVDTQSVTVNDIPVAAGNITLNQVGQLTYTYDGTGTLYGINYTWDFGDGNVAQGDSVQHTYSQSGSYDVMLIVTNNCGADTFMTKLNVVTGIDGFDGGAAITVFPNPFQDMTNVQISLTNAQEINIEVFDMLGRKTGETGFAAMQAGTNQVTLHSQFFDASRGTYFVHVVNKAGERSIHKVIRMK